MRASIKLLEAFIANGLEYIVLCPGSRSGALAIAAGGLAELEMLKLITCIDERSAAFLALGISTASGKAVVVITTSGTAVANLLPAAIEADRSCQPLIFLTADRPERLKNCGANQTLNQEDFLQSVCRCVETTPTRGFHLSSNETIEKLGNKLWNNAHNFAGPVHCNLAFEEPFHTSLLQQRTAWEKRDNKFLIAKRKSFQEKDFVIEEFSTSKNLKFDPSSPGVVVVGPWRGLTDNLKAFNKTVNKWQKLTGWPIFADPLSGINSNQNGLIYNWDLLLSAGYVSSKNPLNILRLGPLPTSKYLQDWLRKSEGKQILVTEGDKRYLDPLKLSKQWSYGFDLWIEHFYSLDELLFENMNVQSKMFLDKLIYFDSLVGKWLEKKIKFKGHFTEPSIAHLLPQLVPENYNFMLSSSTPVRDWLVFGGSSALSRRCFGFRGASGIDGTLSLAMGLAHALGPLVLVSGDLALLHDSNGWLFAQSLQPPLVVVLIDNGGGGIFNQLEIGECCKGSFEDLFQMPQKVDQLVLAAAHNVPSRQISSLEDLGGALEWAVSLKKTVLLRVCTSPNEDHKLRQQIRNGLKEYLGTIIKNNEIEHY